MTVKQTPSIPPDPLIDEIRAIRQAISQEDQHDLEIHFRRLREIERRYADRIARPNAQTSEPSQA
jgi:hypothetical protein